jgi:signal transduction histidine kinase
MASVATPLVSVTVAAKPAATAGRGPWYWLCQVGGWGLVALLNVSFSLANTPDTRFNFILISLWGGLTGLLLSHGWRAYLRRHQVFTLGRPLPLRLLLAGNLLLAAAQTMLVASGFFVWRGLGLAQNLGWLPPAAAFWLFMFLTWTVFYGAVSAARRAKRFELEKLQLEVQVKDAELRALQAQVNPHFFFNSLNSIRALMFHDVPAAAQVVDRLADVMRYTLQMGQSDVVALSRELDAVRAYLAVEKVRFDERLRVQEDIAPGLERTAVPPMALQTLVENAVKYGVEASAAGSDIRIAARRDGDQVCITVANQGALRTIGNSTRLGFDNTSRRLALLFGARAKLDITDAQGWVTVTLRLPGERECAP